VGFSQPQTENSITLLKIQPEPDDSPPDKGAAVFSRWGWWHAGMAREIEHNA
jgi:hypothetical protein